MLGGGGGGGGGCRHTLVLLLLFCDFASPWLERDVAEVGRLEAGPPVSPVSLPAMHTTANHLSVMLNSANFASGFNMVPLVTFSRNQF